MADSIAAVDRDDVNVLKRRAHTELRLCDLPSPAIERILDSMPVKDAARTSILSRKWRYIWASHPTIILDPKHIKDDFVKIITRIFLLHLGPIHKFSLKFPSIIYPDNSFFALVDHLLLFLSRNGIREVSLLNTNKQDYPLPSYVFSVPQLSRLILMRCFFKSPTNFQGFHRLTYLKLLFISFPLTDTPPLLSAPHLESLIILHCTGLRHFKISAPKLIILYVCHNDYVDLSAFLISKHLQTAVLAVSPMNPFFNRIDFSKLFESWSLISMLCIDGPVLMCLTADLVLHKLPTTCRSIKHLVVQQVKFGDVHQIALILCFLRSSPLLSRLEIFVDISKKNATDATESVSNYLSDPQCTVGTMDNLQTVKIENFNGTKAELLFVKLLLSSSPRLKTISVQDSWSTSLSDRFNILNQLVLLPRASNEAIVEFRSDVRVSKYYDNVFTGLV